MNNLHPILGHIFAVEDKANSEGLHLQHCEELYMLVHMALKHMEDKDLEEHLKTYKADMIGEFYNLVETSIVNISIYI
jgi:hypothetical protein